MSEQNFVETGALYNHVIVAAADDIWLWLMTDDNVAEPLNRRVELLFEPVVG